MSKYIEPELIHEAMLSRNASRQRSTRLWRGPSDILSISSDSENDYDNRKPGLRPVEPSPNIAKKRKLVDAAAQTNSEPTPKESWHPRYRPDNHRIKIVSEDGVAFSVEISGLAKRSTVFKDMADVAGPAKPHTGASDTIVIDAPADVVAIFLDLLLAYGEIVNTPLLTDTRQTCTLQRLADKYGSAEIEKLAKARLDHLPRWAVLQYANTVNDINLARCAIARMTSGHDDTYWKSTEMLTPQWQIALIRCLVVTVTRFGSNESTRTVMVMGDPQEAAERFNPDPSQSVPSGSTKRAKKQ